LWPANLLWSRGLNSELEFWQSFFATKGLGYEGFERRRDPNAVMQESAVVEKLDRLPRRDAPLRVLDVGAGPVTSLGRIFKGQRLDIIAVDCLADHYNRLLAELKIEPDVRTLQCEAERLLDVVKPNSCDLVFSRNAIDHGYDPLLSIFNMVEVVKENCCVVLKHGVNEAEESGYEGLHQWNFLMEEGRLILWKQGARWDVGAELEGRATVESFVEKDWLVSICQKL
jgi:SAM-dependent methyltransferase